MPDHSQANPSFSVIIPMYNEETGAERCVREVCAVLDRMSVPCVLIAVEDGSRDGTAQILERLTGECPKLRLIRHPRNLGYGRSLRTGVERAADDGFDYALFMDSDLTNDPADIPRFVAEMQRGVDVIKASRFVKGGAMEGVPLQRAAVSKLGNVIARLLFGIGVRDCTNGFRAVRVAILKQMNLKENGFSIIVEELYQSTFLAKSYSEVPVVLSSRSDEQRPTSFAYTPSTFYRYLCYALKARFRIPAALKPI